MDFLLECIGFPPGHDLGALARAVEAKGEPTPWRGPTGIHKRLPLVGGLEVQLDHDDGEPEPTLWPHYRVHSRVRVEVHELSRVPDSPFDVLLQGVANPRLPDEDLALDDAYPLCTYLIDRRRLPGALPRGHVLAVSIAGFALDVTYVGPDEGARDAAILEAPRGARFTPLGASNDPGGCMDVSARVRAVRHLVNPMTLVAVEVVEIDAPGRPLQLFMSRWQLEQDDLPAPRPGWRVEGCFLFTGRVAGGLPPPQAHAGGAFG